MTIEEMAIAADMAREVPATGVAGRLPWLASVEGLARFAALVRNQALEDAAAAVDSEASEMARMRWWSEFDQSRHIAIALRALIRESSEPK